MTDTPGRVSQLRLVLTVKDFDAAIRVYRDTLGMTQLADWSAGTGRVILLDAGSATLEIADPDHAQHVDELEVGRPHAGQVRIAVEVADVRRTTTALGAEGVTVVAEPTATPWNSLNARFDDPGGLALTVFESLEEGPEVPAAGI